MTVVLDANVLLRFFDPTSAQHADAVAALSAMRGRGDEPRTVPQSPYEFWVVATRPIANTGLGLSTVEADQVVAGFRTLFPLLDDRPGQFAEWRQLAAAHDCMGKVAHDARYAAALRTHGLTHFLTFNTSDFARFPGLVVLDPAAVAAPPPPAAGP